MAPPERQHLDLLDSTVSVIFYALMSVATAAFLVTVLRPEPSAGMLWSAAWMGVLAATGWVVWKLALGTLQDRGPDHSPQA